MSEWKVLRELREPNPLDYSHPKKKVHRIDGCKITITGSNENLSKREVEALVRPLIEKIKTREKSPI